MCSLHKIRIYMVNPSVFFLLALSAKRCTQQDSLWDVVDWWCLSEHSRSDCSQTSQRLGNCMNFWTPISYCGTLRDSNKPDWFGAYAFCTVVLKRLFWKTSNDKIYHVKVSLLQATEAAVCVCVCVYKHICIYTQVSYRMLEANLCLSKDCPWTYRFMPVLYCKSRSKDRSEEPRGGLRGAWLNTTAAKYILTEGPK